MGKYRYDTKYILTCVKNYWSEDWNKCFKPMKEMHEFLSMRCSGGHEYWE